MKLFMCIEPGDDKPKEQFPHFGRASGSWRDQMDKDKRRIDDESDGENEDNDRIFKHDEAIGTYLGSPDAIITSFIGYRFLFKVESGCITDSSIANVEKIVRDVAIDYEYPLCGLNVTPDRIEIQLRASIKEPPLASADRFQRRLKHAGIITEPLYIGTLSRRQPNQ